MISMIMIGTDTDQHEFKLGLIASLLAAICFGSYGVPMKGEAATRVDVDPLVFQTYKAFTVFVSYDSFTFHCCSIWPA